MTSIACFLLILVSSPDDPPKDLDKIEAALKATPNDPMLHYRKCQALFAQGKE